VTHRTSARRISIPRFCASAGHGVGAPFGAGDAAAELLLQVVERPDHQNWRVRLPVPGEIAGEDEAVRRVERAGGLIAVRDLVGAIARRNGQDEEEFPTLLPGVTRYAVEQRPSNPLSSAVGADRHPRNLQAFVKPRLKRQKPHNLAPILGHDPPLCPNRRGAFSLPFLVSEVVRQRRHDRITCFSIIDDELTNDDCHGSTFRMSNAHQRRRLGARPGASAVERVPGGGVHSGRRATAFDELSAMIGGPGAQGGRRARRRQGDEVLMRRDTGSARGIAGAGMLQG
jgi:hypothetical protein